MSYNTFPLLQGLGWPIKVTPTFKTIVQQAASGAEYRTGLWQAPLHLIEVPVNFMTQADWATLLAFFTQQQGSLIPFNFTPTQTPWTANNIQFGTWNGTATSAQLVDSRGNPISSATVSSIYRNDWQGNQLLYPTPRTNQLGTTLIAAGTAYLGSWGGYYSATVQSGASAPDGSTNAVTCLPANASNPFGVNSGTTGVLPVGNYASSIWIRTHTGTALFTVAPDDVGNYLTTTVGTTWTRVANTFLNYTATELRNFQCICQTVGAGPFDVFAPQTEISGQPATSYIYNGGTSPLTLTDYTLTGTTVNLAQAPAATAATTWNGTGSNAATYLVRFPDGVDFEQFMSQLYRTKTLKLQEVR